MAWCGAGLDRHHHLPPNNTIADHDRRARRHRQPRGPGPVHCQPGCPARQCVSRQNKRCAANVGTLRLLFQMCAALCLIDRRTPRFRPAYPQETWARRRLRCGPSSRRMWPSLSNNFRHTSWVGVPGRPPARPRTMRLLPRALHRQPLPTCNGALWGRRGFGIVQQGRAERRATHPHPPLFLHAFAANLSS